MDEVFGSSLVVGERLLAIGAYHNSAYETEAGALYIWSR